MTPDDGSPHRRIRRTRRSGQGGAPAPKPGPPAERTPADPRSSRDRAPSREERDSERSLRGLVGAGTSMVGWVGAMRVRDVARPTEEDLAEAEREVVVVRRNYVPPDRPIPGVRPSRRERGGHQPGQPGQPGQSGQPGPTGGSTPDRS